MFALGVGLVPRGYMSYIADMALNGDIYTIGIVAVSDIYMRQIEILARIRADGLGVDNSDINDTSTDGTKVGDMAAVRSPMRDIQGFLPKLELSNCLIQYKSKFSLR